MAPHRLGAMLLLLLAPLAAEAADLPAASIPADEAAGLFAQSCVPFAGDRPALQAWVEEHHLRALPPGGQEAFLRGQPGTVYDATTPATKLALIVGQDGSCLVATPAIDAAALTAALTRNAGLLGLTLDLQPPRSEANGAGFTWREWIGRKGQRLWTISLGTGSGLAMLGAQRR